MFCSKAGEETGELWLSDRKENEDHLLDSQDYIASRFPGSEYLWVWWQTFLPLLKSFFFQNQTGMGERTSDFILAAKDNFYPSTLFCHKLTLGNKRKQTCNSVSQGLGRPLSLHSTVQRYLIEDRIILMVGSGILFNPRGFNRETSPTPSNHSKIYKAHTSYGRHLRPEDRQGELTAF